MKKEEVFDSGKQTSSQVVVLLYWQPCPWALMFEPPEA